MLERGFVYVVSGEEFINEAIQSALSVRNLHDEPIMLISDREVDPRWAEVFDVVVSDLDGFSYKDKIRMRESPFKKTIFLDSDTTVVRSLDQVFEMLDHFDLAVQFGSGGNHYAIPGLSPCFREPSAGIVAWQRCAATEEFFDQWEEVYEIIEGEEVTMGRSSPGGGAWDQRSLRSAAYFTKVRIAPLPIEFQFITYWPNFYNYEIHMIHGRGSDASLLKELEARSGERIWIPKLGLIPSLKNPKLGIVVVFCVRFLLLALRRKVRLALHHLKLWPLPPQKRPA